MATRRITGDLHRFLDDTPAAGAVVTIKLLKSFATATRTYDAGSITEVAANDGAIDVTLAVPDTGTALYQFVLPSKKVFKVALAAGPQTTLEALFNAVAGATTPQNVVQTAIDAEAALRAAADTALQTQITGLAAGNQTITATASGALSGHRAVRVAAGQASYADPLSAIHVAGLTTGAASANAAVTIQTAGEMVEPTWNWTPGPVYLGSNGTLTQTIPQTGALVRLGLATTPTTLLIAIQPAIKRT